MIVEWKSLITMYLLYSFRVKFLRHVYVYFLAYDIIMLQLPGILFFPEQSGLPEYRTNSISSQHGSRFNVLSLFLIKELISQLIFTLFITLKVEFSNFYVYEKLEDKE